MMTPNELLNLSVDQRSKLKRAVFTSNCSGCSGCSDCSHCSKQEDARWMVIDVQLTEEEYAAWSAKPL